MDPLLIAIGVIGERTLTDQLLNEVLGIVRNIHVGMDDAAVHALRQQLESSIGVSMSAGQGLNNQEIAPWVEDIKATTDWIYWNSYVRQLQSRSLSREVIRVLDADTDSILTECGNPREPGPWKSKGLVMGDVQSGKTANYCGLISKAADAGYKVIVLLTGMIEDLRAQSQERLDEGFVGRDSRELLRRERRAAIIGAGRFRSKAPNVLTSIDSDFLAANYQALGGIPLVNISDKEPVLLVMKKNRGPLNNLLQFLDSQLQGNARQLDLPLLLIDDESDNASVNSRKDEDPATINKLIRKLMERFSRASYVAYTATPFANVFINPDIEEDLFPSNFVYSLNTPTNYMGAAAFFSEGGTHEHCVVDLTDAEAILPYKHRKDQRLDRLPESMLDALGVFLLSCAVRDLRGEALKHRSMLVNASRFTDVQNRIADLLKQEMYVLSEDIRQYMAGDEVWMHHERLRKLHDLWQQEYASCGVAWDEVRRALHDATASIKVVTINQKTDATERLNYGKYAGSRVGRRVVAVGGLTLSRGLTLEGLCVSYFYRNSKAYDTLLQMGRWFGYRTGYDDLCRIWMDPLARDWYRHLADVVAELRHDIGRMHANRMPPIKFGMRVQSHPDALIVTALNKMRNAEQVEVRISYSTAGAETALLPASPRKNQDNLEKLASLLEHLQHQEGVAKEEGNRLLWTGVDKATVARFLSGLHISDQNTQFMRDMNGGSRPLLTFIASNEVPVLAEWDICIPQGKGTSPLAPEVTRSDGKPHQLRPRERQFEKVPKEADYLRVNKQRVGEISDELVGLDETTITRAKAEWEAAGARNTEQKKTIPGWFYRKFRQRPLLTISLITPIDPPAGQSDKSRDKKMPASEIAPKLLVAVSLSFPAFSDDSDPASERERKTARYALNKVALRAAGLLNEEEEDGDED